MSKLTGTISMDPKSVLEQNYKEIYSKADILYFVLNSHFHIVECNVTAEDSLDISEKELTGHSFMAIVPEDNRVQFNNTLKTCVQRGFIKDVTVSLVTRSKRECRFSVNGITEYDSSGEPTQLRLFIKNVSKSIQDETHKSILLKLSKLTLGQPVTRPLLNTLLNEIASSFQCHGISLIKETPDDEPFVEGYWKNYNFISTGEEDYHHWNYSHWNPIYQNCLAVESIERTENESIWTGALSDVVIELQDETIRNQVVNLSEYESFLMIPFYDKENYRGYLILVSQKSHAWDECDMEFMENVTTTFLSTMIYENETIFQFNPDHHPFLNVPFLGTIISEQRKIRQINPWIENFTGYSGTELAEKSIVDLFAPDQQETILGWFDDLIDEQTHVLTTVLLNKAGEALRVQCAMTHVMIGKKTLELWYFVSNEEVQTLQSQLIQARKTESLGMLAGGIVHDFNQQLACILGFSSLLHEDLDKENPLYEDITQINKAAEKAADLSARLMAYSQGGSYVLPQLDVNQLVREVAAVLSRIMRKNISIRAELDPELLKIKADASQIQQMILQVALNARDAMVNGGKILFKTQNIQIDAKNAWMLSGGRPGQYIQIAISDTGVGIEPQNKNRIFDKDFTTKHEAGFQGLGLAFVKEIIDRHKGFISVFSGMGSGTVIKIHLPVSQSSADQKVDIEEIENLLGKETVLLVDDEKVVRETSRKILTRYGYKVITAESGAQAVAIYKKYKDRINLIILDLEMPGMDTKKIIAWLRKLNPKVKILASYNLGDNIAITHQMQYYFAGKIHKPFTARLLLQKMRSIFNQSR